MGRPKKKIDEKRVASLASKGASNRDIAAILGVDDTTIADRFPALLRKKRAERRMRLRQQQDKACAAGVPAMLIWKGKQELDQAEKQELTGKDGGPIETKTVPFDYSKLSIAELEQLQALSAKAST